MDKIKIDEKKLTEDQRQRLEGYNHNQAILTRLKDSVDILQDIDFTISETQESANKFNKELGAVFLDIRESFAKLIDKEGPEATDVKPVTDAIASLEKKILDAVKQQPEIKVQVPKIDAPNVSVNADVDLKGIEKLLKTELPKIVEKYISSIPSPDKFDPKPLLKAFEGISTQLESIDIGTRLKPQAPNTVKVTNVDGSAIGGGGTSVVFATNDIEDAATSYFGQTTDTGVYRILRVTATSVAYATVLNNVAVTAYTDAWTDRATLTYGRYDEAF